MNTFLVILSNKRPELLTTNLLEKHINFLKKLDHKGFLKICGPFTDNKGAVLIINSDSLEQAENLIKQDPFLKENYYQHFKIHEFTVAGEHNNWLCNS